MTFSGTRPWVIAGVIGALLLVALTWLTVIGPTRSETATLQADTVTVQEQNQLLTAEVVRLRARDEDRELIQAKVGRLLDSLPASTSLPELNAQLVEHAVDRGVVLTSISVASATAPTPGVAGATPTAGVATGTVAGMVAVPVTIQTTGPLPGQVAFLKDLQKTGPRAALVTSTSLTSLDGSSVRAPKFTLTTQFTVFSAAFSAADLSVLPQ